MITNFSGGILMRRRFLSIIVCLLVLITGLSGCNSEEIDVVWYVGNGVIEYIGNEDDYYKPIINEKTKAVNERLKKLNLNINIVFKAYKDDIFYNFGENALTLNQNSNPINSLKEIDKDIDILTFNKENYEEYEILDSYLNNEGGEELKSILLPEIWESQKIFGAIYQVPKPGLLTNRYGYIVNKDFMIKHNLTINDFEGSPLEIFNILSSLAVNDDKFKSEYILTRPEFVSVSNFFPGEYKTLMKQYNGWEGILIRNSDNKIVNIFEENKIIEQFEIYQEIYTKDLDGHIENLDLPVIFSMSTIFPEEYYQNRQELSEVYIPISDFLEVESVGYGILKDSKNKEAAFTALSAVYTDATISNILIYGIEDVDYTLKDGHAVSLIDNNNSMPFGTFVDIGNNLITFPSEVEPTNKKELADIYSKKAISRNSNGFIPNYDNIQQEYEQLSRIYAEAIVGIQYSKIENMKEYCLEVNNKLKEGGLDKVINELQNQLDSYLGDY